MRAYALTLLAALMALMPWEIRPAAAADPILLGTFRDWTAYSLEEPEGTVCWMTSKPKKQAGNFTRRGEVYALITHRPGVKSVDVVSFIAGYPFQENSEVMVSIGPQTFRLFTEGDTAWAQDEAEDRKLAQAIRRGSTMVVRGTSTRGTLTTDTYSLSGTTAAYEAIGKACGVTE